MHTNRPTLLATALVVACIATSGCVQRQLTVKSSPPGALVYLNGEEFGRTPVTRDFTWYGTYDVTLRKDGYRTLKTRGRVIAPWWQWVPIDLFAELLPLTDRRTLVYDMHAQSEREEPAGVMVDRAQAMEAQLRGTRHTQNRRPASAATRAAE